MSPCAHVLAGPEKRSAPRPHRVREGEGAYAPGPGPVPGVAGVRGKGGTPVSRSSQPTRMLALATAGFTAGFWAWDLLGPLGPALREDLGLSPFEQSLAVAVGSRPPRRVRRSVDRGRGCPRAGRAYSAGPFRPGGRRLRGDGLRAERDTGRAVCEQVDPRDLCGQRGQRHPRRGPGTCPGSSPGLRRPSPTVSGFRSKAVRARTRTPVGAPPRPGRSADGRRRRPVSPTASSTSPTAPSPGAGPRFRDVPRPQPWPRTGAPVHAFVPHGRRRSRSPEAF